MLTQEHGIGRACYWTGILTNCQIRYSDGGESRFRDGQSRNNELVYDEKTELLNGKRDGYTYCVGA
jgi:hypothetical protein